MKSRKDMWSCQRSVGGSVAKGKRGKKIKAEGG